MKIVILNGPPNVGKDFLADRLVLMTPKATKMEFKWQLRRLVKLIYLLTDKEHDLMYLRENKEKPQRKLGGLSIREAYIKVSEKVIKPNYGHAYFGDAVAELLKQCEVDTVYFSDGGFGPEVLGLLDVAEEIVIVHLSAEGCDWGNDSRGYIKLMHKKIRTVEFFNQKNENSASELNKVVN